MKRTFAFILIFVLALCPLYILSTSASDNFVIEDGVLLSYTGKDFVVNVPENVYYIADNAFENNTMLKEVNLHSGVNIIGNQAFSGCKALKEINNTQGVTGIGAYAFNNTAFLNESEEDLICINNIVVSSELGGEVRLPDNIVAVAPYVFTGNNSITSFVGGENLAEIGEGAFLGCENLSSVNVSDSLSYVGSLAFQGTSFVSSHSDDFVTLGNGILIKYKGSDSVVDIPENIRQITGSAFYGNTSITDVKLNKGTTYIGMRAFANCSALKSITLSEGLLVLEKEAFAKCTSLVNITLPESLRLMGDSVFYKCSSLNFVNINADIDLPYGTFEGSKALRGVVFSYNPERLGDNAFKDCTGLENLALADTVTYIGDNTFSGADNLTVSCNEDSYVYSFLSEKGVNVLQCGDANADGKVNIRDATYIQKYIANLVSFTSLETLRAETNFDGKINIRDATFIQKLLAGFA